MNIDFRENCVTVNSASYCQLLRQNSLNLLNEVLIIRLSRVFLLIYDLYTPVRIIVTRVTVGECPEEGNALPAGRETEVLSEAPNMTPCA